MLFLGLRFAYRDFFCGRPGSCRSGEVGPRGSEAEENEEIAKIAAGKPRKTYIWYVLEMARICEKMGRESGNVGIQKLTLTLYEARVSRHEQQNDSC